MPSEQCTFCIIDFAIFLNCVYICEHQREGFARPAFSSAQFFDCFVIGRVTCEMKSAKTFYGENFSFAQKLPRFQNSG